LYLFSLAGIDSRIFISMLGGDSYINTLFTISTPHLGSRLATILKESTLHANHQLVVEPAIRSLGVNYDMFLTEFNQTNIRELNKTVVDSPNVNYVSVGSKKLQIKGSESLRVTQEIVADSITEDFSNDGIVAAKESVWGTHLINFDADHFELIGMRPEFSAREMFNFYSNVAKYYDADFKKEVKA
jgi:triacylglycerol lipase